MLKLAPIVHSRVPKITELDGAMAIAFGTLSPLFAKTRIQILILLLVRLRMRYVAEATRRVLALSVHSRVPKIMVLAGVMANVGGMMQHRLVRYLQEKTVGEGYLLRVRLTFQFVVVLCRVLSPNMTSFTPFLKSDCTACETTSGSTCSSTDCESMPSPDESKCRYVLTNDTRSASEYLNFNTVPVSHPAWWFQKLDMLTAAASTFYATNGHSFGYSGFQVDSESPFEGRLVFLCFCIKVPQISSKITQVRLSFIYLI